jgi:hypothetical protein
VAIGYVGLPQLRKRPPLVDTPMIIEVVTVAEITNAPPPASPKVKVKETPAPPKVEAPPPPPPVRPSDSEPEVAAVAPPAETKSKAKPKPKPKPKPLAKPTPRPEAPPQLAAVKPQRKPNLPDPFASVLKTVEKLERRAPPPIKIEEKRKEAAAKPETFEDRIGRVLTNPARPHDATRPLTISEIDLVRQQITGCWNLPAGAKEAEDLIIEIWVAMNPDGTVREARIQNQGRLRADGFYRAAAESALRAVLNPRCSPLKLPRDKYDEWQTMTLTFNPREMFGI